MMIHFEFHLVLSLLYMIHAAAHYNFLGRVVLFLYPSDPSLLQSQNSIACCCLLLNSSKVLILSLATVDLMDQIHTKPFKANRTLLGHDHFPLLDNLPPLSMQVLH